MRDLLGAEHGERLIGAPYWADFDARFWKAGRSGFWKLERLQTFQEPGDDSWVAFSRGSWDDALALLAQREPALREHYARIAGNGFETKRVRIVEHPLTEYMQWELHLLNLRDRLGGHTRILPADQVREWERDGVLPELITLGDDVLYRLLYDADGLQEGGERFEGRDLVTRTREFIQRLYARGEPIGTYFEREIASLGPPLRSR